MAFNDTIKLRRIGPIAVLTLNHPPVNALSHVVRCALFDCISELQNDVAIHAIVLHGAGRGFSAGGDRREFGTTAAAAAPGLSSDLHPAIERSRPPLIAALHGFAMGGGLETALACHYRIATAGTRLKFPETGIGLIPLSGTQRLPRVLGPQETFAAIVDGREYTAGELAHTGLFDSVVADADESLVDRAVELAHLKLQSRSHALIRDRPVAGTGWTRAIDDAKVRTAASSYGAAARAAVEAIGFAVVAPDFETGLARARELYDQLAARSNTAASP